MLDKSFERLYFIFRTKYYRKILSETGLNDNSLNATENFSAGAVAKVDE